MAGALLAFHLGAPSPASRALDQIQSSVTRPLPPVPPPVIERSPDVWVPDRHLPAPGGGQVLVPGHWERVLPDGRVHAPPVVACDAVTGMCSVVPAGERLPVDRKRGP